MTWSLFRRYGWLIPCVLAILAYTNSLHNGWHFDDNHSILQNTSIRSLNNCYRYFVDASTFSGKKVKRIMYRPLLLVGYALTYAIGGYHLPLWHFVQIILHALCVFFVHSFLMRICKDERTAFIATLLYAVHPIHTHALNYLCSRSEIQVSIFMLASLLSAMKSSDGDGQKKWQALALFFLACALLTKAIAVMVPFLFLLWDLWLGKGSEEGEEWKNVLQRFLPMFLLVLLYLLLRKILLDSVVLPIAKDVASPGLRLFKDHPFKAARGAIGGRSIYTNLLVQATALWTYVYLFFWPPALSPIHDISPSPTLMTWPTILTVPLTIGIIVLLLYLRRKQPLVSFSGLFFLLTLTPTSLIPLNLIVNEHRVYLASITIFLLIAMVLRQLTSWIPSRHALTVTATLIVGILFFSTIHRNTFWRSSASLWADAKAKAPKARYVLNEYAVALLEAGFVEEALWQMEEYFRLHPFKEPVKWLNVGGNHAQLGNLLLARKYISSALHEMETDERALIAWAILLNAANYPKKARNQLKSILGFHKNSVLAKGYLIALEKNLRDLEIELAKRKQAVEKSHASPRSLYRLAEVEYRLGDREKAIGHLDDALSKSPSFQEALLMKGKILVNSESFNEAIAPLEELAKNEPKAALDLLCTALGGAGKVKEAQAVAKRMLDSGISLSLQARYYAKLPPYNSPPPGWITNY